MFLFISSGDLFDCVQIPIASSMTGSLLLGNSRFCGSGNRLTSLATSSGTSALVARTICSEQNESRNSEYFY